MPFAVASGGRASSSAWGCADDGAGETLRFISIDSACIPTLAEQVPGALSPRGHSYGGAVIWNAAIDVGNVVRLVFVVAPPSLGDLDD